MGFNSTVVRLTRLDPDNIVMICLMFQFYCSTINTFYDSIKVRRYNSFNSTVVRLTQGQPRPAKAGIKSFNSTVVRLTQKTLIA